MTDSSDFSDWTLTYFLSASCSNGKCLGWAEERRRNPPRASHSKDSTTKSTTQKVEPSRKVTRPKKTTKSKFLNCWKQTCVFRTIEFYTPLFFLGVHHKKLWFSKLLPRVVWKTETEIVRFQLMNQFSIKQTGTLPSNLGTGSQAGCLQILSQEMFPASLSTVKTIQDQIIHSTLFKRLSNQTCFMSTALSC